MNFYIGQIYVNNANWQYPHVVRFTEENNLKAEQRLESIAATFYGNIGDPGDDGESYNFKVNDAYVRVSWGACKAISEETYQELEGFAIDQ